MPASRGQSRFPDDAEKVFREVIINDAPQNIRFELIKRSVQDDIQRRTHTIVVIKGRYQQIPIPNDQEGPLRLRVMPGNVGPVSLCSNSLVLCDMTHPIPLVLPAHQLVFAPAAATTSTTRFRRG